MNLDHMAKQEVQRRGGKIPRLKRVIFGKIIVVWALIPANLCFWMLPIGSVMATGIKPSTWAQGKINSRRGNGDLQLD